MAIKKQINNYSADEELAYARALYMQHAFKPKNKYRSPILKTEYLPNDIFNSSLIHEVKLAVNKKKT